MTADAVPQQSSDASIRSGGRQGRPRPRVRMVEVMEVARLSPRWVTVVLGGENLEGFHIEAPTQHLKLLLPPPGADHGAVPRLGADGRPTWGEDEAPPVVRTYTPRRWDPATDRLEVQVFLHGDDGDAPASTWASRATVGDRVAVAGPGGRVSLDLTAPRWLLFADESALPAAGTLLDALGPEVAVHVFAEVEGEDARLPLDSPSAVEVTWMDRLGSDLAGAALEGAAAEAPLGDGLQVWAATEATAVRRIRRRLLDRGHPARALVTRGYWRYGEQNHPDHDYGDD